MDIKHCIELLLYGGYERGYGQLIHVPILPQVMLEREFLEVGKSAIMDNFQNARLDLSIIKERYLVALGF